MPRSSPTTAGRPSLRTSCSDSAWPASARGIPLALQSGDFSRGLGWPLLSLGAIETIGAVFYVFQVQAEIERYRALLASDPEAFQKAELAHIEGTRSRFVLYRAVELGVTLVGLSLGVYGFAASQDLYKGLGTGLFAIGLPLTIVDTVNDGRAGAYVDRLRHFDPTLAMQRDEHGWRLALGGRFDKSQEIVDGQPRAPGGAGP